MLAIHEKAALAIRIVVARYLDDSDVGCVEQAGADAIEEARSALQHCGDRARKQATNLSRARNHLSKAAEELRSLNVSAVAKVSEAVDELFRIASSVCDDGGDGPVDGGASSIFCTAGLLPLVALVEESVRAAYGIAATGAGAVTYTTTLVPANKARGELQSRVLSANTDIRAIPRQVDFLIRDSHLAATDLCELLYVCFHELTCHAFQALGFATSSNPNPACVWSEAWMDTLAYDLTKAFIERHAQWSAWSGSTGFASAIVMVSERHQSRYRAAPWMPGYVASLRRGAREAYRLLAKGLLQNGLAKSEEDAAGLVARFSTLANASREHDELRGLGSILSALLLDRGSDRSVYVCSACLRYIENRDFDALLGRLDAAFGL